MGKSERKHHRAATVPQNCTPSPSHVVIASVGVESAWGRDVARKSTAQSQQEEEGKKVQREKPGRKMPLKAVKLQISSQPRDMVGV